MTRSVPVGEVRPLGDRALLVGVTDAAAGRRLARALTAHWSADAVEVLCGFATVMVRPCDPALGIDAVGAVAAGVLDAATGPASEADETEAGTAARTLTVPCVFDGPDLADVAAAAHCAPAEVVRRLTAVPLTVAVMGFSPGFAYLGGLPEPLRRVARRASPRPTVPAGSVALANGYAAVYPTASPGGWQLVGRTGFSFFSVDAPPYAVLAPGDRVHFVETGAADPVAPLAGVAPPWWPPDGARAVFEMQAPGLRAVLQDGGRLGVAAIGVPAAGPADPVSLSLANHLVGNRAGAGALEITVGTARLRCLEPCHVAVVGGAPDVRLDGTPAPPGQVLAMETDQLLEIGPLRRGLRAYFAVAGGLLGPEVFGSCASDDLSSLGPGPLRSGQRLHAGAWSPPLGDHLAAGAAPEVDPNGPAVELRVVPGPHREWFVRDVLGNLAATRWSVDARSNRVGLRLRADGEAGDLREPVRIADELDSQGGVVGAIQVPPGGEPVILMPDHATLGGYPIVAVVIGADHGLLGQCGPGTAVRLVPVDLAEAVETTRAAWRMVDHAVIGHYPLAVD